MGSEEQAPAATGARAGSFLPTQILPRLPLVMQVFFHHIHNSGGLWTLLRRLQSDNHVLAMRKLALPAVSCRVEGICLGIAVRSDGDEGLFKLQASNDSLGSQGVPQLYRAFSMIINHGSISKHSKWERHAPCNPTLFWSNTFKRTEAGSVAEN